MDSPETRNIQRPKPLDPTIDFLAGTVAGISSLVVGFPFDTVKVRFQDPATASKYTSTTNALSTIIKEESVSGLFKGITSPLLGAAILNGIVFGSYGFFMKAQLRADQHEPSLHQVFLAGAGSGVLSSAITCPAELIKIRQQSALDKVPTVWHVACNIYNEKGIRGLYRGYTATATRELAYGAYFLTYETVSRSFRKRRERPKSPERSGALAREADVELAAVPWYGILLAGGLAGPASWLSTFPADVIKTRMQTAPQSISTSASKAIVTRPPELSTLQTIIDCYRREGPRTFVAGLTPTLIRAVPVNICTFAVFELVVSVMTRPS